MSAFLNRLQKNLRTLAPQAQRLNVEAFRVYDREIPEYPLQVDVYGTQHLLLHDRRREDIDFTDSKLALWSEAMAALREVFGNRKIVIKERRPQKDGAQYQKNRAVDAKRFSVREGSLRFWVDLETYLDTGLFLDHRRVRSQLAESRQPFGLKLTGRERVLNLFCYTGSLSVAARAGGFAESLNVDLSRTYLDWAADNFNLNNLGPDADEFLQADVLQFLKEPPRVEAKRFDLILLDPPTFSRSQRMQGTLDIQRDHLELLELARPWLRSERGDARLLFSTNLRSFRLAPEVRERWRVRELSRETLPFDFRDPKTRSIFELAYKRASDSQDT